MTTPGLALANTSAGQQCHPDRHWRSRFLHHLAETSSVAAAAAMAGVSIERVCKLRRADPDFAREWFAALSEGYLHLEMELIRRLRVGDFATVDGQKFDFASAIRLLAAHRGDTAGAQSQTRDVSAAEVRASIDRKIEEIRRRMARDRQDQEPSR